MLLVACHLIIDWVKWSGRAANEATGLLSNPFNQCNYCTYCERLCSSCYPTIDGVIDTEGIRFKQGGGGRILPLAFSFQSVSIKLVWIGLGMRSYCRLSCDTLSWIRGEGSSYLFIDRGNVGLGLLSCWIGMDKMGDSVCWRKEIIGECEEI